MRFRRSVKLFPGVKLNLSKSGISTSIGVKGASLTLGPKGKYINYGIPGTGIYNRVKLDSHPPKDNIPIFHPPVPAFNYQEVEIKTQNINHITSATLEQLKDIFDNCYQERLSLKDEICSLKSNIFFTLILNILSKLIIVGFFIKWFDKDLNEKKEYLKELTEQLNNCYIDLDISISEELKKKYTRLVESFKELSRCNGIWTVTSYYHIDRVRERSSAGTVINKQPAVFNTNLNWEIIRSSFVPLSISNRNVTLYLYPSFVIVIDKMKKFGLIEYKDLHFNYYCEHFVEDGQVPSDSKVIYYAWHRSNKDGSPDLRFKDNYQIPVCEYGRIDFHSNKGLNESFEISNYPKTKCFGDSLNDYIIQIH